MGVLAEVLVSRTNPASQATSTTFQPLTFRPDSKEEMPPHIIKPISPDRVVIKNWAANNFVVTCEADGHPEPTYQWYRDEQPLDASDRYIKAFTNGTLWFQEFSSREDGLYRCYATNKYGTSVSVKVPLVKEQPPRAVPGLDKTTILTGHAGHPMGLMCAEPPPTVPKYLKRWYLSDDKKEIVTSDRVGADATGALRFAYLKVEDSGNHTCALVPQEVGPLSTVIFYNTVTLQVLSGPLTPTSPRLEYATESVTATLGRSVLLQCFLSGYPVPSIQWLNSTNHVITAENPRFILQDYGRGLYISNVQQEDEGTFRCIGQNSKGIKPVKLHVNVTSPPIEIPHEGLSALTSPVQSDVTLKCMAKAAEGELLDTPVWYRNGQLLNEANVPDATRYRFSPDFTELYISNLIKTVDTACFQCEVSNSEGSLYYDGFLRVIDPIQILQYPPQETMVSANDVIDISVLATGDNCCNISRQWEFNGNTIRTEDLQKPPFIWSETTGQLEFDASSVDSNKLNEWMGIYTCKVSNQYDYRVVTFELALEGSHTTADGTLSINLSTPFDKTGRVGRVVERGFETKSTRSAEKPDSTLGSTHRLNGNDKMTLSTKSQAKLTTPYAQSLQPDSREEMPPHIINPISQDRVIIKNRDASNYIVICKADGHPKPTYQWYKDEQPLDASDRYIKAFTNGTLWFQEFSPREDGIYRCYATNKYGTSVSVKVPLVKEQPPRAVPDLDKPRVVIGPSGRPIGLMCVEPPPTIPKYIKRWYLNKDSKEIVSSDRVGTDATGVLRFSYLKVEDSGNHTCALVPQKAEPLSTFIFYNTVTLQVTSGPMTPTDPRLEYATDSVKATIGSTVLLQCFFSGYPAPNVHWRNSTNHVITTGDPRLFIEDYGRGLLISKVQQEDEGRFTCVGDNGHGQQTVTLNVNVTSPPIRIPHEGLTTLTSPDQRDVTLKCKARAAVGELLDTPKWYRNGQLLKEANMPDPARYRFNDDVTELHIHNLNKTVDTACFQCDVKNSEGYLYHDGFLRVIDSIKILKSPSEQTVISADDVVDISVFATGDACCFISRQWGFNGNTIRTEDLQNPPFIWSRTTGQLKFDASSVDNKTLNEWMGVYTCRVSNQYDFKVVTFELALEGAVTPGPQAAGEDNIKLWWVGLICGLLAILIAVVVIVIFVKSNYPRNTYPLEKTELKHNLNPEEDLLNQSFQEI